MPMKDDGNMKDGTLLPGENAINTNDDEVEDGDELCGAIDGATLTSPNRTAHSIASSTKSQTLQQRLRKLKQRMNQARQLNRQAVQREGEEKLAHTTGKVSKSTRGGASEAAPSTTSTHDTHGVPGNKNVKILSESAAASVARAQRRADQVEIQEFAINDYYNPEGQHRNYLRNVKSLPNYNNMPHDAAVLAVTYDPLSQQLAGTTAAASEAERERVGAQRLAQELHRRMEKSVSKEQKKRLQEELSSEAGEVNYINQRNKRFNAKIDRTYDTSEIRQNLERGTAL